MLHSQTTNIWIYSIQYPDTCDPYPLLSNLVCLSCVQGMFSSYHIWLGNNSTTQPVSMMFHSHVVQYCLLKLKTHSQMIFQTLLMPRRPICASTDRESVSHLLARKCSCKTPDDYFHRSFSLNMCVIKGILFFYIGSVPMADRAEHVCGRMTILWMHTRSSTVCYIFHMYHALGHWIFLLAEKCPRLTTYILLIASVQHK